MILMMKMTSNGSMIIHLPTSLTGIRVNLIILVMGKTVLQSLGFSCTCTVNYTFPADGMIIRLEKRESLKLLKWKWLKMNTGITLIPLYEVSNEWDYSW